MELEYRDVSVMRGPFILNGSGTFVPGLHLVSGCVGTGKTTLAMIAAGLMQPDSGSVERRDIDSFMLSFQFPEQHLTGSSLASEIASWSLDPGTVLSRAGFAGRESDDPFTLSRGELKRLHLACVLSRTYDLLILDEPFSALDCREKILTGEWIARSRNGITLIFTHELQHLPAVDFLWEIQDGRLTFLGSMPDAIGRWKNKPLIIAELHKRGIFPRNLSTKDILEAACGIHD